MLHTVLLIINFFCAAGIVALVLLQRGKGAEAGAGFGSGASGTVFGARGATTALSRTTAILAAVFMLTSLSLSYLSSHSTTSSNSLLDQLSQQNAPAHSAPAPGAALGGAAGGAAAGAAPAAAAPGASATPSATSPPATPNAATSAPDRSAPSGPPRKH